MAPPDQVRTEVTEVSGAVDGTRDFALPPGTSHIAIHWLGQPDAVVSAALSPDGEIFAPTARVELDEIGAARGDGETYGVVMAIPGIRVVRVSADRPLARVSVVAMDTIGMPIGGGASARGATSIPAVIPRSGWGADESFRFDDAGDEIWAREFFPLQKLVVHHTAGINHDPDPVATIQAIYYYHAVTQEWGDIGYQYLIDEAGNVYEGRASRDYWNGASPTANNAAGMVVAGGHARNQNPGSMAIALLGTFDDQPPTAAARASLIRMLAWASATYGIDPTGRGPYRNPVTGLTREVANIAGHRDYNATGCPGSVLYALLPIMRRQVAARVNEWPGDAFNPARTLSLAAGTYIGHRFSRFGALVASKEVTLSRNSSAPTAQRAAVPGQPGNWYLITAGVLAGYWIPASPRTTLNGLPPQPTIEPYLPSRPLTLAAGTYLGHRFDSFGAVTATASQTLTGDLLLWTAKKGTIPNQDGNWYYIGHGFWDGYWIPESAATSLGDPAPPPPPPIAIYEPPRTITFSAGTWVGWRFNAFGVPAASKEYTLGARSSASASRKATIPNQNGTWYYIADGVWADYWIALQPGIALATLATGPLPGDR